MKNNKTTAAKRPVHLRHIFRKWLLFLVAAAYIITFLAAFITQKANADEEARNKIYSQLSYFSNQITVNSRHSFSLKKETGEDLLSKAWALSLLIKSDQSILQSRQKQREILKKLELKAFYITDKTGIIKCSYPSEYENNFDFHHFETTRPYLRMIDDPSITIIEEPRPLDVILTKSTHTYMQQFAGVGRLDCPGIVQVAYSDQQYDNLLNAVSVEHLCDGYTFGKTGFVILLQNGKIMSFSSGDLKLLSPKAIQPKSEKSLTYNIIYNDKKYLAGSFKTGTFQIIVAQSVTEIYSAMTKLMIWTGIFFFIMFGIVFIEVSSLLDKVVVKNINRTNASLKKITEGDLNEQVKIESNEEFISLSNGINSTVETLKKAIADAAARIDRELEFAHAIQISALPKLSKQYQSTNGFDLYADMHPAKEVGGDFYDFFILSNHRLAFVIADVSGKGIPAAMFMMTAKAQIRNHIESKPTLADACTATNKALCEGNDAQMFVTVFIAVLDTETGMLTYVNAGHNPPLICHNGTYSWIKNRSGLFMGSFNTATYKEFTLQMEKGDMVFLYTDGVTEAMDKDGNQYGEARLEKHLDSNASSSANTIIHSVYTALAEHAGSAPQSDDITMLAVQFKPGLRDHDTHIFPAELGSLESIQSFIQEPLDKRFCPEPVKKQIAIAVEELYVNIANYAYNADAPDKTAEVRWECSENPVSITVRLIDGGKPFDPVKAADPLAPASIEEAKIGGLGILMAKKNTDSMQYERKDEKNILTFTKHW